MRVHEVTEVARIIDLLRQRIVTATEFIHQLARINILVQTIRPAVEGDVTTNELLGHLLASGPHLGLALEILIADEQCRLSPQTCVTITVVI